MTAGYDLLSEVWLLLAGNRLGSLCGVPPNTGTCGSGLSALGSVKQLLKVCGRSKPCRQYDAVAATTFSLYNNKRKERKDNALIEKPHT